MFDMREDPKAVEAVKFMIGLAEKDLTRLIGGCIPEQRAKITFYQSLALAMLTAHLAAFKTFEFSEPSFFLMLISAALFASVFLCSIVAMSGANYSPCAIPNFEKWSDSFSSSDEYGFYRDVLTNYDEAVRVAETVVAKRGIWLRRLNAITVFAVVVGCFGLSL